MQARHARSCQARGPDGRTNTRQEQRLRSIDIAHAHDHLAAEQHLLDRTLTLMEACVKRSKIESVGQGLHAEMAQQLLGDRSILMTIKHHCAEPPGVVKPQNSLSGQQINMVMHASRCHRPVEFQAA